MPPIFGGCFDVDASKQALAELERVMSAPDFWNDSEHAGAVSREAADLRKEIDEIEGLQKQLADLSAYTALAEEEGEDVGDEHELIGFEKQLDRIELRTLFSGEHDKRNAILEIHAGSGGTEANDWTAMLLRMYVRYAEKKDWKVSVLFESRGEDVGYKSIGLRIEGRYAYGHLKAESGVHRLVRISPFDAEKMRHTTFALVDVIPEFEVVDVAIDPKDLKIETSTSQGAGGQSVNTTYSAIRIVHIPTGIVVTCQNERSQQQNKETALRVLASRLHQLELKRQKEEIHSIRGDVASAEWGNQIRSYVLHPYKLVKDHRTAEETQNAEDVLDGDLDAFITAYLKYQVEKT